MVPLALQKLFGCMWSHSLLLVFMSVPPGSCSKSPFPCQWVQTCSQLWDFILSQWEWLKSRKTHDNAGVNARKREDIQLVGAATVEVTVEVPQKARNRSTIWPSCITLGPKGLYIHFWDTCSSMFTDTLLTIDRKWKQPRCPSTNK